MFGKLADNRHAARAWYDGPAARLWQQREAAVLEQVLPRLTGYRAVTLGPAGARAARPSATLRHWQGDVQTGAHADFVYDGQSLPLLSGSVDVLILRHALELSDEPHRLMRECARVLSERGQIVCLVFNPMSWWALTQRFGGRRQRFHACASIPRASRLADWLRLVEFETTQCWRYGAGFPLFSRRWLAGDSAALLAPVAWSAGGYLLVARRCALRRIPPGGQRIRVRRPAAALARPARTGLSVPRQSR